MNRYVIKFTKDGYIKYISHLDTLRIFKRAFKRAGIPLRYSQGFNPHPRMGFAQPLSLGYSSYSELLEFETESSQDPKNMAERLQQVLPEGLHLIYCKTFQEPVKSLAAAADAAEYEIRMPVTEITEEELKQRINGYLSQKSIIAEKRQKKTKKTAPVDIKKQIRSLDGKTEQGGIVLKALLDCGSLSNVSPELIIATFLAYNGWQLTRPQIEVARTQLLFSNNLQF